MIWVARRDVPKVYRRAAEKVAGVENLYTLRPGTRIGASYRTQGPNIIDEMWRPVEDALRAAIDATLSGQDPSVDADTWLHVLVEFAAQVFVRGVNFASRFVTRFASLDGLSVKIDDPDHVNQARLLELHRLRGAVVRARWGILHSPRVPLVTNDMGRVPLPGGSGFLIPLRSDVALVLSFPPGQRRVALIGTPDDRWLAGPISRRVLRPGRAMQINRALARSARKELYGPTEDLVGLMHRRNGDGRATGRTRRACLFASLSIHE